MQMPAYDVEIDLTEIRKAADHVRALLDRLREEYDIKRFEYTKHVRIAPGEIPHSYPVLTLNTRLRTKPEILSIYLHEQMHWYVTWFSHARPSDWRTIWRDLQESYPNVPTSFPEGAHTASSSCLHLMVNWLEVEATSALLGRAAAVDIASKNFVYSGIYRIVINEWDRLSELYRRTGLVPIRAATEMTPQDFMLAARADEASFK